MKKTRGAKAKMKTIDDVCNDDYVNNFIKYYKRHHYALIKMYMNKDLKWHQKLILIFECKLLDIKNKIRRINL